MGKFGVCKSVVIDAAVSKVFPAVKSFEQWPCWSPWLIVEPDCTLQHLPDGSGFSWQGQIVGSGQIDLVEVVGNQSITCSLTFHTPIKSRGRVRLVLDSTSDGKGTEVTWLYEGSLPFFMFWMQDRIGTYIRDDLERGLHLLKDYVEKGRRSFSLDFPGIVPCEPIQWIGIRRKSQKSAMGFRLSQDFATLVSWMEENEASAAGAPTAIYHKWDLSNQLFDYTALIPVTQIPRDLPVGFEAGEIPRLKCYQVHLRGSFWFLPHAWACGVMHGRSKVFRKDGRHAPFERFIHMPDRVEDEALEVILYFPCR